MSSRLDLRRLIREEEGHDAPTDEDLRKFDKKRKTKKVPNDVWRSETDPDSGITRMQDGRTHLAYKAEHAVDLETELILAAEIYHADQGDTSTLEDCVNQSQFNLIQLGRQPTIKNVVADKGYHSAELVAMSISTRPIALTYLNANRKTDASGSTSTGRTHTTVPSTTIDGESSDPRVRSCSAFVASMSSEVSLTSVKRAVPGELASG